MANDPTVKAGSWGARTVEKIVRLTEHALRHELPVVYLVDSAGARITDQVELFPGRRGAGRIFANQVRLSGKVPQVCCLFGPSAAGGAYIPAFCDAVFMVEANASMYLGSPRMAEVVIGEKVSLEEMGGARMHATVSGCGDNLCASDEDAIDAARRFLSYLPDVVARAAARDRRPRRRLTAREPIRTIVPKEERRAYDMHKVIDALVDADSFFELKPLWAKELIIGFARLDGEAVGIVANNPMHLGGVLFVDSADKAARFIWLCDAFNVPLVFLADVPGFMIGSQVERQGIIRHGAKMITAVAEATVPKFSVIVRKAYGAGLYAMCGPAFDPDACLALPTAQIAVMGPDPAVNAVFYNRIQAIEDPDERAAFVAEQPPGVHRGRRPRAPRRRARGRRGGAARGSPRRAGAAPRARRRPRPRRRGEAPRRPAGLTGRLPGHTGCGAAWLARLTGGQEVAGSNPASPTTRGHLGRASLAGVCIVRRMPRMQVYLPDELFDQLKARGLPASELLQQAVRAELRRQALIDETDVYLDELIEEVGEPTANEIARAEAIARQLQRDASPRAG